MKADLYNHERRYKAWKVDAEQKEYVEDNLSDVNSKLLIQYVFDMEQGLNVSAKNKKGARSYHRLNAIRQKVKQVLVMLEEREISDIRKIKDIEIVKFFNDMSNGNILTHKGQRYKSVVDYTKAFKSFWHWYQKVNRKKNIDDVTADLNTKIDDKPKWVYLDESKTNKVIDKIKVLYKPVVSFLYDSGARVTETFSLNAGDVTEENGVVYVNIRNEISKGNSSGRKIKLLLCGKDLIKYIKDNKLNSDNNLFSQSPFLVNRELKVVAKKLFGDSTSQGGERYSNLSMYDFRHNACCFWLPKYKTSQHLMYRFGWKSERYIHYYSEFLGLKDNISTDDMYSDVTKTELEKQLDTLKKKFKYQEDMQEQVRKVLKQNGFIVGNSDLL